MDRHAPRPPTGGPSPRPVDVTASERRAAVPRLELVRSDRRRRGAAARIRDGAVVVRLPAGLGPGDEDELVERVLARLHERAAAPLPRTSLVDHVATRRTRGPRGPRGDRALVARADEVADRWLDGLRADRVTWSHRMQHRWGSCTVDTRSIRLSARLADAPDAVVDHVLHHELCHLLVADHGREFRALLRRDPATTEVARWLRRRSQLELRVALGLR